MCVYSGDTCSYHHSNSEWGQRCPSVLSAAGYVTIVNVITSSLIAFIEYTAAPAKLGRCNASVLALTVALICWSSLSDRTQFLLFYSKECQDHARPFRCQYKFPDSKPIDRYATRG